MRRPTIYLTTRGPIEIIAHSKRSLPIVKRQARSLALQWGRMVDVYYRDPRLGEFQIGTVNRQGQWSRT